MTCEWADDSHHLISDHTDTIRNSPSEIYHYALPLAPPSSWLRKYYSAELSREVKVVKGVQAEREMYSHTVSTDDVPRAPACWKGVVVVGFDSGDISILDKITRIRMSVHSRHTDSVRSLAISSDGLFLASGSNDKSVKFCDIQTGGVVKTFHGHTGRVRSVSISPDRTTIASGSVDETIRLWNIRTGECRHIIDGHSGTVNTVGFSPKNSRLLISASDDCTVRRWDINGRRLGPIYEGRNVTFSSDGTRFVSCITTRRGGVATVRNSGSGAVVAELQAPNTDLWHCCFSPDAELVVVGGNDKFHVWNLAKSDPRPVKTFVGHDRHITSLVFSSSVITSSQDGSIKFWQVGILPTDPVAADPENWRFIPAPIESVTLLANDGIAVSCDSAGSVRTWDVSTGLCKASFCIPTRGMMEQGEAGVIDGRLIFCWCSSGEICLWDTEKGELFQTVRVGSYLTALNLRISGDGSKVFLLYDKSIRAWSIQTGKVAGKVEFAGKPLFSSLVVDGSKVWVRFEDSRTQGWDFGFTGSSTPPIPLSSSSAPPALRPRLDFIDLIGTWHTEPSRIEDTVAGEEVFRLSGKYEKPNVARWDGRYLVAGYHSGEVVILDLDGTIPQ